MPITTRPLLPLIVYSILLGASCSFGQASSSHSGAGRTPAPWELSGLAPLHSGVPVPNAAVVRPLSNTPATTRGRPIGSFDAAGARIGMDFDTALKAIAITKPEWALALTSSSAAIDCSTQGRAIVNLQYIKGLPSTRMDARCYTVDGKAILGEISILTLLIADFPVMEAKSALIARYGLPTTDGPLAGGGFEMSWSNAAPTSPGAIPRETLRATLQTRAFDSAPVSLSIHLIGSLVDERTGSNSLGSLPL